MPKSSEILTANTHGFQFNSDELAFEVRWSDVREIETYKRDLMTHDLICLGFRVSDADEWVELNEGMSGFDDVVTHMEREFQIPHDWSRDVMLHAFETNLRVLWCRDQR